MSATATPYPHEMVILRREDRPEPRPRACLDEEPTARMAPQHGLLDDCLAAAR